MSLLQYVALCFGLYLLLSPPLAVLIGTAIRRADTHASREPADDLAELEAMWRGPSEPSDVFTQSEVVASLPTSVRADFR